jgi:hypothetical protein
MRFERKIHVFEVLMTSNKNKGGRPFHLIIVSCILYNLYLKLDDGWDEQRIDPDWINNVPPVMRTYEITGDDLRTRAQAYYAHFYLINMKIWSKAYYNLGFNDNFNKYRLQYVIDLMFNFVIL